MILLQEIICHDGQLAALDTDMEYDQFESNGLSHHNTAMRYLGPLMNKI